MVQGNVSIDKSGTVALADRAVQMPAPQHQDNAVNRSTEQGINKHFTRPMTMMLPASTVLQASDHGQPAETAAKSQTNALFCTGQM